MMGGTDDLRESIAEGLRRAQERKAYLLKELEVTESLIEAQQKALKLYGVKPQRPEPDAEHSDKTLLIANILKAAENGLSIGEAYEQVRQHGIERDYVRKVLGRLTKQGKATKKAGRYFWAGEK